MDQHQDAITWTVLLSRCAEFAKAAVALSETGEGGRWKRVVGDVITLHSVSMALHALDEIEDLDRPVALDRAEILCRAATESINETWRGEVMPGGLVELIDDARIAFEAAANAGVEWVITAERHELGHPGSLAEKLIRSGFRGEFFLAAPGQPVFKGAPVAFARGLSGAAPTDEQVRLIGKFLGQSEGKVSEPERIATPRQVYRQIDFMKGGPVKDLVVPMNEPVQPGQPILILVVEAGEACAVPLPPPSKVRIESLPVEIMSTLESDESGSQED